MPRRYSIRDGRVFITRVGIGLDGIAGVTANSRNGARQHDLADLMGEDEPQTDRKRLWIHVHWACRYDRASMSAARADLTEGDVAAPRSENRALEALGDHLEA